MGGGPRAHRGGHPFHSQLRRRIPVQVALPVAHERRIVDAGLPPVGPARVVRHVTALADGTERARSRTLAVIEGCLAALRRFQAIPAVSAERAAAKAMPGTAKAPANAKPATIVCSSVTDHGSLATVGYREFSPPAALRDLVECAWVADGPPEDVRVLPDGCMDLIRMEGRIVVAGPDTTASVSPRGGERFVGLRFHPGVLPRLLGVPASELRDERVALSELRSGLPRLGSLRDLVAALASQEPRAETAPWSLSVLGAVTSRLAGGSAVTDVAREIGWSNRTLQRQCTSVYGYGPATLRRILRFRRAALLLSDGLPPTEVAARAGYADQPHLHREVRELAGVPLASLRQDSRSANRSTQLPSGSATVA